MIGLPDISLIRYRDTTQDVLAPAQSEHGGSESRLSALVVHARTSLNHGKQ